MSYTETIIGCLIALFIYWMLTESLGEKKVRKIIREEISYREKPIQRPPPTWWEKFTSLNSWEVEEKK